MEKKKSIIKEKITATKPKHAVKVAKPIVKKAAKKEVAPIQSVIGMHTLKPAKGSHKPKKLLGRGSGSGHGKTSTRGSKGQTSRAGRHFYLGFEGGQSPLIRRMPKRGFTNIFRKEFQIINLQDLSRIKEPNITPEVMEKAGLIKDRTKRIKLLGDGQLKSVVNVQVHAISQSAADKIKTAGGKVEIISEGATYGTK